MNIKRFLSVWPICAFTAKHNTGWVQRKQNRNAQSPPPEKHWNSFSKAKCKLITLTVNAIKWEKYETTTTIRTVFPGQKTYHRKILYSNLNDRILSTCKTRQNRQITYSTVQFKLDLAKFRCQIIFVSTKESYCRFYSPRILLRRYSLPLGWWVFSFLRLKYLQNILCVQLLTVVELFVCIFVVFFFFPKKLYKICPGKFK